MIENVFFVLSKTFFAIMVGFYVEKLLRWVQKAESLLCGGLLENKPFTSMIFRLVHNGNPMI